MKRRRVAVAVLMILCVFLGGFLAYSYNALRSPRKMAESGTKQTRSVPTEEAFRAHLYFIDENHEFLRAEEQALSQGDSALARAKSMISALIRGPKGHLLSTLPPETRLLAFHIREDGIGYADFSRAIRDNHPGGCLTEMLTIMSVVNTLALNLEEVESVKFLIEGDEAETLAGHIDIHLPFRPNVLMIK